MRKLSDACVAPSADSYCNGHEFFGFAIECPGPLGGSAHFAKYLQGFRESGF